MLGIGYLLLYLLKYFFFLYRLSTFVYLLDLKSKALLLFTLYHFRAGAYLYSPRYFS